MWTGFGKRGQELETRTWEPKKGREVKKGAWDLHKGSWEKKGAGKASGKVGTGNGQPESTFTLVYWGFIPSFPTKGQLENDFNLTEDFSFNFVSSFRQV